MNLRTLLNRRRFVGCVNPRAVEREKKVSLFCEETEEGACLMMERNGLVAPLSEHELPPQLMQRVRFWNAWCSSGFNDESDVTPSVFGLEAYAVALAADVSYVYPEDTVDWCGLAVHDDYALLARKLAVREQESPTEDFTANRYLKTLLRGEPQRPLPHDALVCCDDFDYGYARVGLRDAYDSAKYKYPIDERKEPILTDLDCPPEPSVTLSWLRRLEFLLYFEGFSEWEFGAKPPWRFSRLMLPFLRAALATEWARTLPEPCPVSLDPTYVTGADVLRLWGKHFG